MILSLLFLKINHILLTFFTFHLSQLLYPATLSLLSSAHPYCPAYPFELILGLVRFLLVSDSLSAPVPIDFRLRAKVSLSFVLFAACAVSGMLGMVSMCWVKSSRFAEEWVIRGFGVGLLYELVNIYKRRWFLEFPIIQVTFCVCLCVWVLFAFSEVFNLGLCSGWMLRKAGVGGREF
jgi:nucleoporin NDC1